MYIKFMPQQHSQTTHKVSSPNRHIRNLFTQHSEHIWIVLAEHENCTGDCCTVKAYTAISLLFGDVIMNLLLYRDLQNNFFVV